MTKKTMITGKVDAKAYVVKNGYPEVGQFSTEKDLQKFYKQLSIVDLEDWATLEGCTYKPCKDSEPIHRMRVCMSILYKHFPKETSTKSESPYKKYTLEDLVSMAVENEVPVEPTDDDRIMRMRCIMSLRAAKIIC